MNVRITLSNRTGIIRESVLDVDCILELNRKIFEISDRYRNFVEVNKDDFKRLYNKVFDIEEDIKEPEIDDNMPEEYIQMELF